MAYAESGVGGSIGGSYRVWVNSIRVYDGTAAENFEDWRAEGGLNKVGGGTAYNGYNTASYTLQLGINGVASSGNFSYSFGSGTGTVLAWGTSTTRANRDAAGVGFGFQSRMDINLANSPYLTTGWVTSNDTIQTKYRQATLTSATAFTDEENPSIGYSNPAGSSVTTLMAAIYDTTGTTAFATYRNVSKTGSSYTFTLTDPERDALRAHLSDYNLRDVRFYLRTNIGGSDYYSFLDRTLTIVNANPVFSNFTYKDTNAATVAVTGSDQVLIQGKSDLEVTISAANKAVAQKQATRSVYNVNIGSYSSNSTWPASGDVVHDVGIVSDVSGVQSIGVRAVDSRSNGKIVNKPVTIIPYSSPAFVPSLSVSYTNYFDATEGLTLNLPSTTMATISPMTFGSDLNSVNTTSGIQFDLSKGDNTSYTGTWVNVANARVSGSTDVTVTLATVASAILTKMDTLTLDNTVKWYVKFKIVDALETQYYEIYIDIGKSIFRIGMDEKVYNKEEQLMVLPVVSVLADNKVAPIGGGTGTYTPYVISSLYVKYGTGLVNSSTVLFDIIFDFNSSTAGMRTWALKVDGNIIGSSARPAFVNTANVRTKVVTKIPVTGLAAGTHTVQIEIYGGGNNVNTDTACFCTVVTTEWANANTPLSTGVKYAGTVVDGGGGGKIWSNPSNAQGADNGTVATVLEGPGVGGGFPNQLMSSVHGISVPGNVTITGIMLEAKIVGTNAAQDYNVDIGTSTKRSLVKPTSSSANSWVTGGLAYVSWGGPGVLWGRTDWAPADVNSSTFGAGLSAYSGVGTTSTDQVDAIRITVYYT